MTARFIDWTKLLLSHCGDFENPDPATWTGALLAWFNDWQEYVAKGGNRPPTAPPHP